VPRQNSPVPASATAGWTALRLLELDTDEKADGRLPPCQLEPMPTGPRLRSHPCQLVEHAVEPDRAGEAHSPHPAPGATGLDLRRQQIGCGGDDRPGQR